MAFALFEHAGCQEGYCLLNAFFCLSMLVSGAIYSGHFQCLAFQLWQHYGEELLGDRCQVTLYWEQLLGLAQQRYVEDQCLIQLSWMVGLVS